MHLVSTAIDMPEGVEMSDAEDGNHKVDANDPHRALDINLDEPMEQRPVPKRPPPALKMTAVSKDDNGNEASAMTGAVDKKAKKSKKNRHEEKVVTVTESSEKKRVKKTKTKKEKAPPVVEMIVEVDKKAKKDKKKRKDKDAGGGSAKATADNKTSKLIDLKVGYEEAIGISTPSKEFS